MAVFDFIMHCIPSFLFLFWLVVVFSDDNTHGTMVHGFLVQVQRQRHRPPPHVDKKEALLQLPTTTTTTTSRSRRKRFHSFGRLYDHDRNSKVTVRNDNADDTAWYNLKDAKKEEYVDTQLQIFDHVLSKEACTLLHELALEEEDGIVRQQQQESFVFSCRVRPENNTTTTTTAFTEPLTPLETALASIVKALYGNTHDVNDGGGAHDEVLVVEYWTRQEYLNLDIHADLDETHLETNQNSRGGHNDFDDNDDDNTAVALRHPKWGHVLYLQIKGHDDNSNDINNRHNHHLEDEPSPYVNTNEDNDNDDDDKEWIDAAFLRAPTVVFDSDHEWKGPMEDRAASASSSAKDAANAIMPAQSAVTIVPAVPGRLLRFPGHALHAVPKPVTRWVHMTPQQQLEWDNHQELGNVIEADDDEFWNDIDDDDDDDDDAEIERSVILFNVWIGQGPLGVPQNSGGRPSIPDGIVLEEEDQKAFWQEQMQRQRQEWSELYGHEMSRICCNARTEWKPVPVAVTEPTIRADDRSSSNIRNNNSSSNPMTDKLYMPLMGNRVRRKYPHKFVTCQGSAKQWNRALHEIHQPTRVQFVQSMTSTTAIDDSR